jgi:glycosyltransferase involved in cell wall biosynthesis
MKLSIITVNLNNCEGLQRTIDSVVCQTFRDFEWIVIDGGSTDGSKELIERYADHFAYWVSEPDKGIYNAMNKGIKVAKGDYLQFLNSGDCLKDSTTLSNVFSCSPVGDIIYGDCAVRVSATEQQEIHYKPTFSLKLLLDGSINHQSSFIKRELLLDEPYDESLRIVSDRKFFIRKALEGKSFVHINRTISTFDINGISTTQAELLQKENNKVTQEEVPACILEDNRKFEEMKDALNDWQIKTIRELKAKRPLFHRMITANIKKMQLIDKIL